MDWALRSDTMHGIGSIPVVSMSWMIKSNSVRHRIGTFAKFEEMVSKKDGLTSSLRGVARWMPKHLKCPRPVGDDSSQTVSWLDPNWIPQSVPAVSAREDAQKEPLVRPGAPSHDAAGFDIA